MRTVRAGWQAVVAAFLGGLWAVASLAGEGLLLRALIGVLVVVAVLPLRRWPIVAGLAVAGLVASSRFFGIPADNPWDLAAGLTVLFAVGRFGNPPASAVVAVVFWGAFVARDFTPPTGVFGAVFVAAPLALGTMVRRRAEQAESATEAAAELASIDATERAARVAAEERTRLAGDVLGTIRTAVVAMREHAERASAQLDPAALAAVQDEGRKATSELRRLLGLLRSEDRADASGSAAIEAVTEPVSRWWRELLVVAGLIALFGVEATAAAAERGSPTDTVSVVACLALIGTVVLRQRQAALACVLAAVVPAVALGVGLRLPYGLWSGVVAALLAWSVATTGGWRPYTALGVFAGLLLLDVYQDGRGNEGITLVTVLLAGIAGHVWAGRVRVEHAAQTVAAALRAHHEVVAEDAVRAERLRLARELHDVSSHAIGVMVLQAGAARALRDREPERAHEAVRTILTAATEALTQLEALFQLLDEGAVGAAGVATSGPVTDLGEALEELGDRIRAAGLQVGLEVVGSVPDSPVLVATIYRIVQESLTNAMRHAPGSLVEVAVVATGETCEILILDEGPPRRGPAGASSTGGFGLVGLTERVNAVGGELVAGPRPSRGFAVRARLPIDPPVETRA